MRPRVPALLAFALLTAACTQSGASPSPSAPASAQPTPAASATTSPGASGAAQTEIIGVDYAFEEVPSTVEAGTTLAFKNEGAELHEMVIVRKNDDTTQSWDELLQLPDEEAFQHVEVLGAAYAMPGAAAADTVTVERAGEYLMICFVPVGTTSESIDPSAAPSGPPHFTRGMRAEFTVAN